LVKKEKGLHYRKPFILYCRGDLTRTDDPLHPMQMREPTAPHPALTSEALAKEVFDRRSFSVGGYAFAKIVNKSDIAKSKVTVKKYQDH